MNPRAAINDLLPFQGSPFSRLGTSPTSLRHTFQYSICKLHCCKRRRWDSNPRSLSESLVFKTSSLNHSDTSPNTAHLVYHLIFTKSSLFLYFFSKFPILYFFPVFIAFLILQICHFSFSHLLKNIHLSLSLPVLLFLYFCKKPLLM